jgi:CHAD domain-containing protein
MVESLLLKEYTRNRFEDLAEILGHKKNGYSTKDYHGARVEIKKLNAISGITKFCCRSFRKRKFISPFKKMFSLAGKIREVQLEAELFSELGLTDSLGLYLENSEAKLQKLYSRFKKMSRVILKKVKKNPQDTIPCFNKISREKIYRFIESLNCQVAFLAAAGEWEEEEVHDLRKKLKELLYTINIFQLSEPEVKSIDALQDLIGKWHDKVVMARNLTDKRILNKMNRKEKITLQPVVEKLNQSSGQILKKIHQVLNKEPKEKATFQCFHNPVQTGIAIPL